LIANKINYLYFNNGTFLYWLAPNQQRESGTKHFPRCLISAPRLLSRRSSFPIQNWILDCGAFSRFHSHGQHLPIDTYVSLVKTWQHQGLLDAWISQDWLCHRAILKITNLSIVISASLTN
jgi:hypothetical protein